MLKKKKGIDLFADRIWSVGHNLDAIWDIFIQKMYIIFSCQLDRSR
jgi:hypothetical protein